MPEKLKILIAEDNEDNRVLLVKVFQRAGFETFEATDGGEAIIKAKEVLPHIILMDLSMKPVDGCTASKSIKSAPETSNIPIIAITAHAMDFEKQRALECGMDDYITKPINTRDIVARVQKIIGSGTSNG